MTYFSKQVFSLSFQVRNIDKVSSLTQLRIWKECWMCRQTRSILASRILLYFLYNFLRCDAFETRYYFFLPFYLHLTVWSVVVGVWCGVAMEVERSNLAFYFFLVKISIVKRKLCTLYTHYAYSLTSTSTSEELSKVISLSLSRGSCVFPHFPHPIKMTHQRA